MQDEGRAVRWLTHKEIEQHHASATSRIHDRDLRTWKGIHRVDWLIVVHQGSDLADLIDEAFSKAFLR